ncbi:MAG TPA: hypothetical protein VIP51_14810, partial [Eoetvoesiella sp.]
AVQQSPAGHRFKPLDIMPAPGDSHTSGQRLVPEPARHDALGLGNVQRTVVMADGVRHGSVRGRHLDGGSVGGSTGPAVKLMDVSGRSCSCRQTAIGQKEPVSKCRSRLGTSSEYPLHASFSIVW